MLRLRPAMLGAVCGIAQAPLFVGYLSSKCEDAHRAGEKVRSQVSGSYATGPIPRTRDWQTRADEAYKWTLNTIRKTQESSFAVKDTSRSTVARDSENHGETRTLKGTWNTGALALHSKLCQSLGLVKGKQERE